MKEGKNVVVNSTSSRSVGMRDIKALLPVPISCIKTLWDDEGRTTQGNVGQVLPDDIVTYRSGVNPTMPCKVHPTECWVSTQPIKRAASKGFTLIELLVVVLIIGILAAIALPQYQKAIEKSKAMEAITLLKTLDQFTQYYYMEHNKLPTQFDDLDTRVLWAGKAKGETWSQSKDHHSTKDWSVNIHNNLPLVWGISINRLAGKYAGGGFYVFNTYPHTLNQHQIYCTERVYAGTPFAGKAGEYCEGLFHGKRVYTSSLRFYALP